MDDLARRHEQIQAELRPDRIALPCSPPPSRTTRRQRRQPPLPRHPARPLHGPYPTWTRKAVRLSITKTLTPLNTLPNGSARTSPPTAACASSSPN